MSRAPAGRCRTAPGRARGNRGFAPRASTASAFHTIFPSMFSCLKTHKEGLLIHVKVTPGASRAAVSMNNPEALTVRLTSAPVEGKANKELIRLLAKALGVAPSRLSILSGETSRRKVVLAAGVSMESGMEAIAGLAAPARRSRRPARAQVPN